MTTPDGLFGNLFDSNRINNDRLGIFTGDTIGKLSTQNTGNRFDAVLALLNASYPAFTGNVSGLDNALNLQKGGTMTVEGVMTLFKKTMSEQEPFIAVALGGRTTPAFLEFYPRKISEYSKARQNKMLMLTTRVNTAATANSTALGTTLTATLQAFKTSWTNAKAAQNTKKGTVSSKRGDRNSTRTTLELNLCTTIHTVGMLFPGDVAECLEYFNFSLLYNTVRHTHITKSGTIIIDRKVTIFDVLFPAEHIIIVKNTTINAVIIAYFAAHEDDEPAPGTGIIINPLKEKSKQAEDYGDVALPFFIIKNMSNVNDATYVVETKSV